MEEIIEKIIDEEDLRKPEVLHLLGGIIEEMHLGKIRLAEKQGDLWKVNKWVIDSINYYFLAKKIIGNSAFGFDKENMQFKIDWLKMRGVRALEGALVRSGAYIAPGVVLMPSFVNIGAYVDEGSMIDTWATIGIGAQIGKRCHISGGVGIGGILEPIQEKPVIIEDDCFIGSRCVIAEGVHIAEAAVLGAGVILTGSTKIFDVNKPHQNATYGYVPPRSVVIMGSKEKTFPGGKFNIPCAIILGERTENTDKKISLNETLRKYDISK